MGSSPATKSKTVASAPRTRARGWRRFVRPVLRWVLIGVLGLWSFAALLLIAARWIDPPTTALQMQRRFQAFIHGKPYQKRQNFVALKQIAPDLQHAVVAAEDARFYQHYGFDLTELQKAVKDDLEGERTRGASTLTQQLVKNLFFGTQHSFARKGAEGTLVPVAEFFLGKQRILELYLNVVEGDQEFTEPTPRAAITTGLRPRASAASSQRNSRPSCPIRSNAAPNE